jgi:hypothetical protein
MAEEETASERLALALEMYEFGVIPTPAPRRSNGASMPG